MKITIITLVLISWSLSLPALIHGEEIKVENDDTWLLTQETEDVQEVLEDENFKAFEIGTAFLKENEHMFEKWEVQNFRPEKMFELDDEWHLVFLVMYGDRGKAAKHYPDRIAVIVDKESLIARFFLKSDYEKVQKKKNSRYRTAL